MALFLLLFCFPFVVMSAKYGNQLNRSSAARPHPEQTDFVFVLRSTKGKIKSNRSGKKGREGEKYNEMGASLDKSQPESAA